MPKKPQAPLVTHCPYCEGRELIKAGKRYNRNGAVQLYQCNHCSRKFRERTAHRITYPIHAIIETVSLYNHGYTLDESARRAGNHHRIAISKQVAATWKARYTKYFPYKEKDRKFNRMCPIIRVGTCPTESVGTAPLLRFDTPSPVVLSEMGL
jgi:DNA-directed RNA polymerase subunit RPC12/RpoP